MHVTGVVSTLEHPTSVMHGPTHTHLKFWYTGNTTVSAHAMQV